MSTNIYNYNGTLLATVADGVLDTTSATIKFPGDGYLNYGEPVNENMLWIMQNFARATQPDNPVTGQTWYDTGNNLLKVYNGSGWSSAGEVILSATQPVAAASSTGTFWYDTVNNQILVNTGTEWLLIGPLGSSVNADPENPSLPGNSCLQAVRISDNVAALHQVWRIIIGGTLIGIISKDSEFTPDPAISGFAKIKPGLNFNSNISNIGALANSVSGGATGSVLYQSAPSTTAFLNPGDSGTVLTSNGIGSAPSWAPVGSVSTVPNLTGGSPGAIPYQSSTGTTSFVSGGATGSVLTSLNPTGAPYWASGVNNLTGGAAGSIPYQSSAGVTNFIAGGTAGYVLTSNGASVAPTWQSSASSAGINMQVYDTAGSFSWTVPANGKYKIIVIGAGGGGGSTPNVPGTQSYCGGAGGGAGGTAIGLYQLSAGNVYSITVGGGGTPGSGGTDGVVGNTSSVTGTLVSLAATGGAGGKGYSGIVDGVGIYNAWTPGGLGSGGNIMNLKGGEGAAGGAPWVVDLTDSVLTYTGGVGGIGGSSTLGGYYAPGAGGHGGTGNNNPGIAGSTGIVIIEWIG